MENFYDGVIRLGIFQPAGNTSAHEHTESVKTQKGLNSLLDCQSEAEMMERIWEKERAYLREPYRTDKRKLYLDTLYRATQLPFGIRIDILYLRKREVLQFLIAKPHRLLRCIHMRYGPAVPAAGRHQHPQILYAVRQSAAVLHVRRVYTTT